MPPKLSIVTPSFNQGRFLEETILSVLNQEYPNLEYLIIDGGSTDETVDVIRRYEDRINFWVSEKDRGQVHAINKGIEKTTGDIFGFINSDDVYLPGTFDTVMTLDLRGDRRCHRARFAPEQRARRCRIAARARFQHRECFAIER